MKAGKTRRRGWINEGAYERRVGSRRCTEMWERGCEKERRGYEEIKKEADRWGEK